MICLLSHPAVCPKQGAACVTNVCLWPIKCLLGNGTKVTLNDLHRPDPVSDQKSMACSHATDLDKLVVGLYICSFHVFAVLAQCKVGQGMRERESWDTVGQRKSALCAPTVK